MKIVSFVALLVLSLLWSACSSSKNGASKSTANNIAAQASSGNEVDFVLASSFCLDTDSSIVHFKTKGLTAIEFELINRWGVSIIKTIGPEFIPSRIFPSPPAAMEPLSQLNWRLSYTSSAGKPLLYTGTLLYLNAKCKQ
jgi:hypothetical protein